MKIPPFTQVSRRRTSNWRFLIDKFLSQKNSVENIHSLKCAGQCVRAIPDNKSVSFIQSNSTNSFGSSVFVKQQKVNLIFLFIQVSFFCVLFLLFKRLSTTFCILSMLFKVTKFRIQITILDNQ